MSRNLVVCLDGTGNEFGRDNTNVVRLYQALVDDPTRQRCYYDPGVGTMGHPGAISSIAKGITKFMGMAFGLGATHNILDAYTFLVREYREGDLIWIFGFSRGALEARALAALLYRSGLLKPELESLAQYAVNISRTVSKNKDFAKWRKEQDVNDAVAKEFRETFSREVKVHFLGLWDTVTSMGAIWSPKAWPYTTNNPAVAHVRHAIALDERRNFFRQNRWGDEPADGQTLKEIWFAGVHSDVGGGYPANESDLWTHTLQWMAKEVVAGEKKLLLKPGKLEEFIKVSRDACAGRGNPSPLNDSMKGLFPVWYIAEFIPKPRWSKVNGEYRRRPMWPVWHWFLPWLLNKGEMGRARIVGRARTLQKGEWVHRSAIERFANDRAQYQPEPLLKIGLTKEKAEKFLEGGEETYRIPKLEDKGDDQSRG